MCQEHISTHQLMSSSPPGRGLYPHVTDVEADTRKGWVTPEGSFLEGNMVICMTWMSARTFTYLMAQQFHSQVRTQQKCILVLSRRYVEGCSQQCDVNHPKRETVQMPSNGRTDKVFRCGLSKQWNSTQQRKGTINMRNNLSEYQKHNNKQKKADLKEHTLHDSIYVMSKNRHNSPTV